MAVWRRQHFLWIGTQLAMHLRRLRTRATLCRGKVSSALKLIHLLWLRKIKQCVKTADPDVNSLTVTRTHACAQEAMFCMAAVRFMPAGYEA